MYLNELYLENTGPISKCHVKPPFDDAGNPLPTVIVGPNGSGKTILLSYIVDALTEFAKQSFHDIVPKDGISDPFFRIIGGQAIRSGQPFSLSLLHFKATGNDLHYYEKAGTLNPSSYTPELDLKPVFASIWNWPTEGNHKHVSTNKKTVETEMINGAHAFFPASRREDPDWLNPKSLKVSMSDHVNRRFNDELDKPLWVATCAEKNLSWVLDVFLDSLVDLDEQQKLNNFVNSLQGQNSTQQNTLPRELLPVFNRLVFARTRKNIEQILKTILQDGNAELILNFRNIGSSRISIKMGNGIIIPTLQSLSEGQSQLFHLFATIIRYGERTDLNKSVNLTDITGLVIIDEIDTHLHPTLQHDVLPQLIAMFPKVQFIVSSHSPLFLLGMEKRFGADKVTILEMPDGNRINSERYSEFGRAFEYYQSTERYVEDIKQHYANMTKPVVLTEGKTDARYIQTALKLLGEEELLNSLEIRPVGKEGDEGDAGGGNSGLDKFYEIYAVKSSIIHQPILLLYDSDVKQMPKPVEKLSVKRIPENSENTEVPKGIENLFSEELFEEHFYDETVSKLGDGGQVIKSELNKTKFCGWICEQKNVDHFAKFDSVVQILKEFFEAHQPPQVQQPPPE